MATATTDLVVGQPVPLQQRGEERFHRKPIVLSRLFVFDMVVASFGVVASWNYKKIYPFS
jgi:hypothetical protein